MKLTFFDEVLFVSHSVQSEIIDTINNNNNNNKLLLLLIDKMFKTLLHVDTLWHDSVTKWEILYCFLLIDWSA